MNASPSQLGELRGDVLPHYSLARDFALDCDAADILAPYRRQFELPLRSTGLPLVYLNQVCGQDVRDVGPLLADASGVSGTGRHGLHPGGDDPVQGIKYLTRHYTVEKDVTNNHYDINYVDDRDTANIHADGDLTIKDSFNQDNDFTVDKADQPGLSRGGIPDRICAALPGADVPQR